MDVKLMAAVVTASASIVAVAVTYMTKLLSEFSERRRTRRMHLTAIRIELSVNARLAAAMSENTRTYGFYFSDESWLSADRSVVFSRRIPADEVVEVYALVRLFNILAERYVMISEKEDYGPNRGSRLAEEHAEMLRISGEIGKRIPSILGTLPCG
ncbi:MAG: hypothetical protein GY854_10135 [Deltaproteobacteria bacterium]|nr:hypothetical protein [Deltaproteobacteria bacterium]